MTAEIIIAGLGVTTSMLVAVLGLTWHLASRLARVEQRIEDHDRWERDGRSPPPGADPCYKEK